VCAALALHQLFALLGTESQSSQLLSLLAVLLLWLKSFRGVRLSFKVSIDIACDFVTTVFVCCALFGNDFLNEVL
jgi:hypothetical protein